MAGETANDLLQQLCADLRLMWQQAGGPSLRALGPRVRLGKSQLGAILNGTIRRPPSWPVVRALVECFHSYADDHGTVDRLSLRAGVSEFWRPRYTMLEFAFNHPHRSKSVQLDAVVPRQLPPQVRPLVGRESELAALDGLAAPDAPVCTAIVGAAGIGKSALAVSAAHRVSAHFPDGQLYMDLSGATTAAAVTDFLAALGSPTPPGGVAAQVGLYRSLVAGRRLLVVLDNAADARQVLTLLPGAAGCQALVTSRDPLVELVAAVGARYVPLGPLTAEQARALLVARLGTGAITEEPGAIEDIVAWSAGRPQALACVAARAAAQPRHSLATLARALRDGRPVVCRHQAGHDPHHLPE